MFFPLKKQNAVCQFILCEIYHYIFVLLPPRLAQRAGFFCKRHLGKYLLRKFFLLLNEKLYLTSGETPFQNERRQHPSFFRNHRLYDGDYPGHITIFHSPVQRPGTIEVFYGNCILKNVSCIPPGTFLAYPDDVLQIVEHLLQHNPNAHYGSKMEVLRVLKEAANNGQDPKVQFQHILNVSNTTNPSL